MKERLAKEAEIRKRIFSSITSDVPCHDIWVWLSEPSLVISYVYPANADLESHEKNGTKEKVDKKITQALNRLGYKEFSINYHSHQYVLEKFNGNYDKYFR